MIMKCIDIYLCLSYGAATLFTHQPQNTTVNYGEIVKFNCSVRNYMNHGLEMFIGGNTKIFPSGGLNEQVRNFFENGEFYAAVESADNCTATSCEGTGIFRMVANSRTLPLMEYFWCRTTHNGLHEESNLAFAEVLYPESFVNRTSATTYKPVNATKIPYAYSDMTFTPITNNGSQINLSGFILLIFFSVCLLNVHG